MDTGTVVGLAAAACTTLSHVPQLKKCWETGAAGDLSLRMLVVLATGAALWIGYGILRSDWIIIAANTASALLLLGILSFRREPQTGASQALRSSEERYRAVVESTRDYAIFTTDRAGRITDWYPGAAAVFGWSREEILGRPSDVLFLAEDRAAEAPRLELETAAAQGVASDVRWHLHKNGSRVFIEGKVVPVIGAEGGQGFLKIGQDVTERRRAERALRQSERHLQVLVRELQHRTRNLLAVVRALFESTARDAQSPEAFRQRFVQRLSALSRAQALLAPLKEDENLLFEDLLRGELEAHGADASADVTLDGPAGIHLESRQVQILALVLHELATNAVKHGALASAAGRLAVRWRLARTNGREDLEIEWRERGVEVPATAALSGYGRELIERALPYQLDAGTHYELTPDGVHCRISVPLAVSE
jgi:PAS domain S-box-containing protein